jgi:Rha family phage regulatory protein
MNDNQDSFASFEFLIASAPEVFPVVTAAPVDTMSSLTIAEITGKNHADVMRDIRISLEQAEIGVSKFAASYRNSQNKEQPCYHLPRRECDLVVSGYSVKYRLAIIDRWHELETRQAMETFAIPQTLPDALRLAADLADKNAEQAAQLAIVTPKAAALELIAASEGSMCITNAAKTLQMRPKQLFAWLQSQNWIFRRGAEWIAYESKRQQGMLEHKLSKITASDGTEKTFTQARLTPKGISRIAELLQIKAA